MQPSNRAKGSIQTGEISSPCPPSEAKSWDGVQRSSTRTRERLREQRDIGVIKLKSYGQSNSGGNPELQAVLVLGNWKKQVLKERKTL
jgi:hypothetical protein